MKTLSELSPDVMNRVNMEFIYTVYTKEILEEKYYFVKRYMIFPEIKDSAKILDGFGMHKDFKKCCHIAGITDDRIIDNLRPRVEQPREARVIQMTIPNRDKVKRIHWNGFSLRNFSLYRLRFKF